MVAAFGQILSQEILDIPEFGCLNIHASLLPKYRGASPIQHVIIDGEEKTGITIMQMDAGLDTGDMLYPKENVSSMYFMMKTATISWIWSTVSHRNIALQWIWR